MQLLPSKQFRRGHQRSAIYRKFHSYQLLQCIFRASGSKWVFKKGKIRKRKNRELRQYISMDKGFQYKVRPLFKTMSGSFRYLLRDFLLNKVILNH